MIFQTMNSVRSNNLSLKYQKFTTLDSKDKGIIKLEFVTKTQFLSTLKYLRSTTLESKDIGFRKAKFVAKIQFL